MILVIVVAIAIIATLTHMFDDKLRRHKVAWCLGRIFIFLMSHHTIGLDCADILFLLWASSWALLMKELQRCIGLILGGRYFTGFTKRRERSISWIDSQFFIFIYWSRSDLRLCDMRESLFRNLIFLELLYCVLHLLHRSWIPDCHALAPSS